MQSEAMQSEANSCKAPGLAWSWTACAAAAGRLRCCAVDAEALDCARASQLGVARALGTCTQLTVWALLLLSAVTPGAVWLAERTDRRLDLEKCD